MSAPTIECNFPVLHLAEAAGKERPADARKRMLRELVGRLNEHHSFVTGQFVVWKAGLKNKLYPDYGEPVIVTGVYPSAVYDGTEVSSSSPYYQEPLTLVIGVHREDDLLEFRVDGRRFEPVESCEQPGT